MNVKNNHQSPPASLLNFSHASSAMSQTGPASLILIGPLLSLFDRCLNFIGCHRTYFFGDPPVCSKSVLAPWTKTPHGKFQVNQTLGGVHIAILINFFSCDSATY